MFNMDRLKSIGHEKVLEQITASGYKFSIENPDIIIAGLYNSDLKNVLVDIIKIETDLFINGMKILKYATNAKEMQIYLPEGCTQLSNDILEDIKKQDISINYGLINKGENKSNILCHFEEIVKIAKLFNREDTNFTYISIDKGELQKVSYGTKIESLLDDNMRQCKVFEIGNKYYEKSILSKNIEDITITNGIIRGLDEESCIVNEAAKTTYEYRKKSCGKCLFCREGLIQLNTMMDDITVGKGKLSYISLMSEIGKAMKFSNNCSLGEEAADIVISSLEIEQEEYLAHIKNKKCTSGVCISNENIYIDPKICTGCEECVSSCTLDCIDGRKGYIHMIYDLDCTKCGKCIDKCKSGAIKKTIEKVPRLPDRLIKAKMFR